MKYISIILLAWMTIFQTGQDLYVCKNAQVTLFSTAPIEDINASTSRAVAVFNAATGDVSFMVPINSFQFPKSLMQEHFNADYMESDKYPRATFKGRISRKTDLTKDGVYPVTASGELTVHGVTVDRTIPGTITVVNGLPVMRSEFMVKCVDHHIEIPRIVFHNIAESIKITITASFTPSK
ncbi:MAG TPA: YceI family protein [Mucilaginibacter sp.]|nr:YceI family protein [Mucilaginibacter sp.]